MTAIAAKPIVTLGSSLAHPPFGGVRRMSAIAAILTAAWSVDHHPNG
jgi:hypothetical protein